MSGNLLPTLLFIALILLGIAIVVAIVLAYKYLSVKGQIADYARREFEQWRASEIETVKQEAKKTAEDEAQIKLEEWKSQVEQSIRQDAIQKSRSVTMGQVTEQFIPYLPDFPYNPKDARFIGDPIDFVVFDGLYDGKMKKVVIVEVKTGTSGLNPKERLVRNAIQSGCGVEWKEVHRKPE
jgi:predicted Holliday junction resolvase-like endonuclease